MSQKYDRVSSSAKCIYLKPGEKNELARWKQYALYLHPKRTERIGFIVGTRVAKFKAISFNRQPECLSEAGVKALSSIATTQIEGGCRSLSYSQSYKLHFLIIDRYGSCSKYFVSSGAHVTSLSDKGFS